MHEIQLAIVHATGMAQRKKSGQVVDSFPECEDLRKKALVASSYLMEKRAKARLKNMHAQMTKQGCTHTQIALPASTRAAAILINWESLIKEKWNLTLHWLSNVKAKDLTDDEFYLIAQLSSVLFPIGLLVRIVQSDIPGAISYTMFFTLRTWVVYLTSKKWYVWQRQDGQESTQKSIQGGMEVTTSHHAHHTKVCPSLSLALERRSTCIPMVPVLRANLHPTAKKLLDRLIQEMTNYGVKVTKSGAKARLPVPLLPGTSSTHVLLSCGSI
jgi:hypothetical protein